MTSLEIYQAIRRELDQYESPMFTNSDFNYWYQLAQLNVIDNLVPSRLLQRKVHGILGNLFKIDPMESLGDFYYSKPDDFYLEVRYETTVVDGSNQYIRTAEPMIDSKEESITLDEFRRPRPSRTYYREFGDKIEILCGGISPNKVYCYYIRKPAKVNLVKEIDARVNPDTGEQFIREAIRETVKLFLENTENRRYQTQLIEEQRKK